MDALDRRARETGRGIARRSTTYRWIGAAGKTIRPGGSLVDGLGRCCCFFLAGLGRWVALGWLVCIAVDRLK